MIDYYQNKENFVNNVITDNEALSLIQKKLEKYYNISIKIILPQTRKKFKALFFV